MAVRSTMAALISAVRLLINDPSAVQFPDQAVQDALDHVRVDYNYLELADKATINPGGLVSWLDYYAMIGAAGLGDWEADAVLQGYPSFGILAPVTSDYLVGHWTFDTSLSAYGQRPPVYLIGKTYDRFAAAAELLEDWAASLTMNFDFGSDQQRFQLSQKGANLLVLAERYKRKARPHTLQMTRSDTPQDLWQRHTFDINRTTF